jgi:hypothetical protein
LDDVQFLRRGWHHRDKIKTKEGIKWLTVPVLKKGKYHQLFRDVQIDNSTGWRDKHLKTLEYNYRNAPNFAYCFTKLQEIYNAKHTYLIDLNMALLRFVASAFDIITPTVFASRYNIQATSSQRLVALITSVGGSDYLTGMGAKSYLDETLFRQNAVNVIWQEYSHPHYQQLHGKFVPMLSSLDFIMMQGNKR